MKTPTMVALLALSLAVPAFGDDAANYVKHCSSCHGKDGKGQTTMGKKLGAKDFSDAKAWADVKDDVALKNLKEGVKKDGKEIKKPFAGKLTEPEMKSLIEYCKKFKK